MESSGPVHRSRGAMSESSSSFSHPFGLVLIIRGSRRRRLYHGRYAAAVAGTDMIRRDDAVDPHAMAARVRGLLRADGCPDVAARRASQRGPSDRRDRSDLERVDPLVECAHGPADDALVERTVFLPAAGPIRAFRALSWHDAAHHPAAVAGRRTG